MPVPLEEFWADHPAALNWHELVGDLQDPEQPTLTAAHLAAGRYDVDRILEGSHRFTLTGFRMLGSRIGDYMWSNYESIPLFWLLLVSMIPPFLVEGIGQPVNLWMHIICLSTCGWGAVIGPYFLSFRVLYMQGLHRFAQDAKAWLGHPNGRVVTGLIPRMNYRRLHGMLRIWATFSPPPGTGFDNARAEWLQQGARLLHITVIVVHPCCMDNGWLWYGFFLRHLCWVCYFSRNRRIGYATPLAEVFNDPDMAIEHLWVQVGAIALVQLRHQCWAIADPETRGDEPAVNLEANEEMCSLLVDAFGMYENAHPGRTQALRTLIRERVRSAIDVIPPKHEVFPEMPPLGGEN
ncbi:hypothetical protein OF83DRAFT_1086282 [Amylostereum chailletii]|nr:hypothetical protein OF83DRAFT_1086282 [Amylostereum chailletii]